MPAKAAPSIDARQALERHVGQIVRKLRLQQNLTIAEVARKAQCSGGMLSKIENGQTSASVDTLASLADALGTTLSSVFAGYSTEEGGEDARQRRAQRIGQTGQRIDTGGGDRKSVV